MMKKIENNRETNEFVSSFHDSVKFEKKSPDLPQNEHARLFPLHYFIRFIILTI